MPYSFVAGRRPSSAEQYIQFRKEDGSLQNIEAIGPYNQVSISYFDNHVVYTGTDTHLNPTFEVTGGNEVTPTKADTEISTKGEYGLWTDVYTFPSKQSSFRIDNVGSYAGYVYQIAFEVA